ncbi:MAG: DNA gyrase C-terminal beta-propeller domain-containing protein, partial [bacterium]|nr:DNA gyrase C-terminal beta-propeller domain-containing protein [bacterium]
KEILEQFIKFQEEIVTRRTRYDLEKAEARMHILEGLKIALANIDEIIEVIRNSYDDAKERLMERFNMSEIQAQSVLDMRLGQLQRLNGEKIEAEYDELSQRCDEYRELLSDRDKLMEKIKDELIEIRDRYGDERLTQLEAAVNFIDDEDLIEQEQCVITMTHFGYIKRIPADTYKVQHRGGRGISGLSTREEDFVENIFTCSSHDHIMFFTSKGRVCRIKGYRIPEASRHAKGTAVVNILPLEEGEKITATIPISEFSSDKYLTMITKNGFVKKTSLDEYDTNRKGGIIAIGLREGDELIKVALTEENHNIILGTKNGMCIKFAQSDVRPMGRAATGVTGIRLKDGDYVIGGSVCDDDSMLLSVSENGYGKKTDIGEFKCQNRAGKGVTGYNITDKTGPLAGMSIIKEGDDLMSITSDGVIIRMSTDEISKFGRVTQGVKVMKIADDV